MSQHNASANSAMRYASVIQHVQEVILTSAAELAFWRTALRREGLFPFNASGSAEIVISAPRLEWMGFKFCELSVCIWVAQREDAHRGDECWEGRCFCRAPTPMRSASTS